MLKTNTELQISLFSFKCRHYYSGNDYTGLGTHPKPVSINTAVKNAPCKEKIYK